MNLQYSSLPRLGLVVFALASLGAQLVAQTATVTVNAASVVRDVPIGLMGSNTGSGKGSKFWESLSPAYRADAMTARMGMVRVGGYPDDVSNPAYGLNLAEFDTRIAQVLNTGGSPLFIQMINDIGKTYSDTRDASVHAKYMDLNGNPYPAGSTVPTAQRIATNITFLVKRYKAAPFYLTNQVWEIGNEPDINVNYQVENSAEYITTFNAIHNQLVASGVRGNVTLCGPSVSWDYGFGGFRDTIMNDFLTSCASKVDIVTRHIYGLIYSWESSSDTPYTLLNASFETAHFNSAQSGSRGEGKLLATMTAKGVPSTVGTGVTEMNLFQNSGGPNYRHTITQGLWFLLSDHYSLYNPRSRLTTGFKFDIYGDQLAYYKSDKSRSFPYWATYIHGVLTGDKILANTSSDSHIVVTASKDDSYLYVQVLNRHDTNSYTTTITINNAPSVGAPTLHVLSATATPDAAVSTSYGTTFTRVFAPMTASVLRFRRNDAPVPPVAPAAPTTVLLSTAFDTAPTGMQTYAVGYTPVVASSHLQLTSATTNTRAAVVFNGQPLPVATTRAQIRFGFKVDNTASTTRGEGFVFGAYSQSPGAVGNSGQALGYSGQNHRLWGIKIDNNPDQVAIVGTASDGLVEGWATQPLPSYAAVNMYAVIDYEGTARTVRTRIYQGTSPSGTLRADVTNRVGVPTSLPAGTVFGFTAATTGNTQLTYIQGLAIAFESGGTAPSDIILDNTSSGVAVTGSWTAATGASGYYGSDYLHDQNAGKGNKVVQYTPTIPTSGYYEVFARWTAHDNRASNVPITIAHAGGSTVVPANQQLNNGTWMSLGTYSFNAGTTGKVTISNAGTSGYVVADAVKFVWTTFAPPEDVILDNTSSGVAITGTWTTATGASGYYGSDYLHDGNAGKGTKTVQYTPTIPTSGTYEVFSRWTAHDNRASNVPITIVYSGGSTTVPVNQQLNNGTWMSLGSYGFNAGTTGKVTISNTGTTGYVAADAVKFVWNP